MHDGAEMTYRNIETGNDDQSSIQLGMIPPSTDSVAEEVVDSTAPVQVPTVNGVTCPECSGFLIFQEGCQRCASCGYNKCE